MRSSTPRWTFSGSIFFAGWLAGAAILGPLRSAASAPETVTQGAALFTSSGCTQCHGPAGLGTAKGPSLREVRKHLSKDATRTQIHDGGQSMPPFGDALSDAQIASLVEFLHAKNGWKLVPATSPSAQ